MNLVFSTEQKRIIELAGAEVMENGRYSEDEALDIDVKVKDFYVLSCFDLNYKPTADGCIARQVINYLGDML